MGTTPIWPDYDVAAGIQCTPTGFLLACFGLNTSTCAAAARDPGGTHSAGGCLNENGDYSAIQTGYCSPDDVDRDGTIDRYLKFECASGVTPTDAATVTQRRHPATDAATITQRCHPATDVAARHCATDDATPDDAIPNDDDAHCDTCHWRPP
jgi:hypothetical protein